nr:5-formyltetrahydrofolate cyclo-ligase [Brevibacterium marinum]
MVRVDAETSKAQLRARIRSERADRAVSDPAIPAAASSVAGAASPIAGAASSVAEAAWQQVEQFWPDLDLAGRSMLAYAALSGEPGLDSVIDRFLAHGGSVYLPVVTKIGHALTFGSVADAMATLEPQGNWGIREPASELTATELLTAEVALDLAFVPALGFGAGGARLGNGGGFYDRTFGPQGEVPLATRDQTAVYGVCFASELDLPGLTVDPWDLQIARAVTDAGVHTLV